MEINGTKVIDATKPVKIIITARDVANGDTKDPGGCAAALALMRECHATAARVHIGRTYIKTKEAWLRFETPKALRSEIIAFDRGGGAFAPGEYAIRPLSPGNRLTGKRRGGTSKNVRPRKLPKRKRMKYHTVSGIRQHGANR